MTTTTARPTDRSLLLVLALTALGVLLLAALGREQVLGMSPVWLMWMWA